MFTAHRHVRVVGRDLSRVEFPEIRRPRFPACRTSVSESTRPRVVTLRAGNRSPMTGTGGSYPQSGDAAHRAPVRQRKLAMVMYRVMQQRVREDFLLLPSLEFRLLGENSRPTTDVRRCLLSEDTPTRQTSRKAGTQSHEATAQRTALRQSSRRTVHWRSTDATDAPARLCRRHLCPFRLQRK
jgi:hypothetical protein